jgi:glucokinase
MIRNYIIGVDIGGTRTKSGLVDLASGKVLDTIVQPTEKKDATIFINQVTDVVNKFKPRALEHEGIVTGIGFGVPGFMNDQGDVVTTYGFLEFMENYPLKKIIEDTFSLPCLLDNDARIVSLGEALYGKGKNFERVLTLTLGTGVGFGFVVNGNFTNSLPVEHMGGHMSVSQEGGVCYCGKTGCLEALVSSTGITREIRKLKRWDNDVSAEALFIAATEGNADALRIVDQLIIHLQSAIYNYVNLLAPDIIILGGGITKGLTHFFAKIKNPKYLPPYPGYNFELEVSDLEELAGMLGSAALFRSAFT